MKLFSQRGVRQSLVLRRGFSMIEIAIALAVIAFAIVAIIGILPLGLTVQRDNRAETIINQDATYWLEAIRGGAQGIEDLTNYVDEIVVTDNTSTMTSYSFAGLAPGTSPYFYGSNIISLLTQPYFTNATVAYVRAISGAAGDKGSEVSFKYQMKVETTSASAPALAANYNNPPPTLHEVRMAFAWPVKESVAPHKPPPSPRPPLLYRTLVSRNVATNNTGYLFTP